MIELFRSLYDHQATLPTDENFYGKVMNLDRLSSIAPQLYMLLKDRGLINQTPSFFQEYLREAHTQTLFKNIFIKHQTEKIIRALDKMGIEVIPLKGVFFSESYFGHTGARPTSDIDLLVNRSDIHKATDCIKKLGFSLEEEALLGHFHCSLIKELPGSPVPICVEVHWGILKEDTSTLEVKEFWEESTPLDGYNFVYELSAYHTFYLMCLHAWRHNFDSFKCYLDLLQMLYVSGEHIDFLRLKDDARQHKTWTRVVRTLSILYQTFPFMRKVRPFPYERRVRYAASTKTTGALKYVNFIDYHLLSYDSPKHGLIGLYTGMKEHAPIQKVKK
ncbi:nucleotidyltransferase family protein [Bacillus sp. RAR_GA_16]|uniref:nucleotidyltransferase family protein n=1 Tax=Bacillus sp. RAR_GA_16 TaxID=2876774 RepID=UPI001CCFBFA9|nr:nucleotidyltransferase family protein [Bacillus sp. RAR_GA_16]MCA0172887.1 nucleotidyltransferase family protein [Bacillus sp. RAR_GA_16]